MAGTIFGALVAIATVVGTLTAVYRCIKSRHHPEGNNPEAENQNNHQNQHLEHPAEQLVDQQEDRQQDHQQFQADYVNAENAENLRPTSFGPPRTRIARYGSINGEAYYHSVSYSNH